MRATRKTTKREPTIALINVVFLMLIFFLIAGTVAAPINPELTLVKSTDIAGAAPPDGLIIHADGSLEAGGQAVADAATFIANLPEDARAEVRIIPNRDLSAAELLRIGATIQDAGTKTVIIATERALE